MRRIYTLADFRDRGLTRAAIRWGERAGNWRKISYGIYGEGPADPTPVDHAIAVTVATRGVASGSLVGVRLDLDSVEFRGLDFTLPPGSNARRPGTRRRSLPLDRIVNADGVRCTNALQTLLDLAAELDDLRWEQALESALRKRLTAVDDIAAAAHAVRRGATRIRRVLALRPPDAPPTESLLETLMVQLARTIPGLPPPVRQFEVYDKHGNFVARVDLAWPELGLFIELDGQHHKGQPVYDARRETAVVAATGWLCGRFTWHEVVRVPKATGHRLAEIADQARRRPIAR